MNISKILRITPDGAAFTTAHGTFYPFVVGFDDQHSGQANSKSNPPPWKVGEIVGYEVTGQTPRGADKFKIKRNPEPQDGTYYPPHEEDRSNPDLEAAVGVSPQDPLPYRPVHPKRPPGPGTPRPEPQGGASLPVYIPNGQTIGMATKAAVDIWLKTHAEQGGAWDAAAIAFCFGVANQIIGISRRLEKHAEESAKDENVPF